jgi:hypothetical protein
MERLLLGETQLTNSRHTEKKGAWPKRLLKGPLIKADIIMNLSRKIDIAVA